jgi:glycosyltransferase involved in cell wall biosynthesis
MKVFSSRPIVVTLWGTDVQWIENSWALRILANRIAGRADVVASVNDYFITKLRSFGFSKDNIRLIPNGVDLDRFGPLDCAPLRAKNGLSEETTVLIYVGSLIERKGVKYLIEAMKYVVQHSGGPVVLAVVGAGEERESLEAMARRLGLGSHILFVGSVPPAEMPAWFRCADLFVLPSLYEGRPNVVLEALAAELPVVATDIPGTRELVVEGENGFLVAPRSAYALAQAMVRLIGDPTKREKMGKKSREMVLRLGLTWDDIARRYLALYQELSETKNRRIERK